MANDLKPCPFCGGEADLVVNKAPSSMFFDGRVDCDTCDCFVEMADGGFKTSEECVSELTRMWNRRSGGQDDYDEDGGSEGWMKIVREGGISNEQDGQDQ